MRKLFREKSVRKKGGLTTHAESSRSHVLIEIGHGHGSTRCRIAFQDLAGNESKIDKAEFSKSMPIVTKKVEQQINIQANQTDFIKASNDQLRIVLDKVGRNKKMTRPDCRPSLVTQSLQRYLVPGAAIKLLVTLDPTVEHLELKKHCLNFFTEVKALRLDAQKERTREKHRQREMARLAALEADRLGILRHDYDCERV